MWPVDCAARAFEISIAGGGAAEGGVGGERGKDREIGHGD